MYHNIIFGKTALLGMQNAADWYFGQSQKAFDDFLDAIDARLLDLKTVQIRSLF